MKYVEKHVRSYQIQCHMVMFCVLKQEQQQAHNALEIKFAVHFLYLTVYTRILKHSGDHTYQLLLTFRNYSLVRTAYFT